MKLLLIFAAILALSLAEDDKKVVEVLDDSEAEASANIELLKDGADLNTAASQYASYVPPSQRPNRWNTPDYAPPQNTWNQPKPVEEPSKPAQTGSWVPPVQNDYYWSTGAPHYPPSTTTTPVPVIHQSQYFGDDGSYKYEYQIADGTHVAEEGYFTDPRHTDESVVKKGSYSFVGADGKTYKVTYWADHTGYHAYGDHLPKPAPVNQGGQQWQQQNQQWQQQNQQWQQNPAPTPAPVYYPTSSPIYNPTIGATAAPYPSNPAYPPHPTYAPAPHPVNNQGYAPSVTYPQQQQQQQIYYPPQQPTYPGYGK